jgi:hypothetical protein
MITNSLLALSYMRHDIRTPIGVCVDAQQKETMAKERSHVHVALSESNRPGFDILAVHYCPVVILLGGESLLHRI